MKSPYLVNDPTAIQALIALQSDIGTKSRFGNADKYPSMKARIEELQMLTKGNAAKVAALAKDETRLPVVSHGIAKDLAERTSQAIRTVAQEIAAKAAHLQVRGQELADETLAPRPGYGHLDSEIRAWMREAVKSPEGMAKVSELAKKDSTIAAIIYHSPEYLTGLSSDLHARMKLAAVERFAPKAYEMLDEGVELEGLGKRYEKVVSEVHSSFYTPHLADKGATRVEVD